MAIDVEKGKADDNYNIQFADEYVLTNTEKSFLLACERGDISGAKTIIDENKDKPEEFNINCVDPINRSALISAIENENFDLIIMLLENGIEVGDALLHAISEEYVEAVEELLQWEEANHKEGTPYSWESVDRAKSAFTADITPLVLAAHRNNYEILKMLLDRGATLPMPHDVKCGCDECVASQETDSLRHSQSRINQYRALSSSSLISLSSRDPVLTAIELAWELKRLQAMESEFRADYTEMRNGVQAFVTSLLDHVRTSAELELMLNYDHENTGEVWSPGQHQTLGRLKLAIKYNQKTFVAHPNVQQLLASIWYEGLPGFRRKKGIEQIIAVTKLGCMFPIHCMKYIMAPESDAGKFMKKPFVKFITHSCSYMFFLMLLAAASLRVVQLTFELLAFPWMLDMLDDWRKHERGSLPGPIELVIIVYITSIIFSELRSLYTDGFFEYVTDLWNIVDFTLNMFYVTWIICRATSWIIVHRDLWFRNINPYFPREHWHPFDPMLLSEGAFAAGNVFSYLKLIHIFSINPHLGPLQVSLGRMIIDIIKFFFIYTLVLFAFGCGLNQLLWYYAEMEKNKCYHLHPEVSDFDDQEKACTIWRRFSNLFETSQSLFWASFGLVDLVSFDLAGIKGFTRFWALLMFGSYCVINVIVLLNMLIGMMSNSYQIISERADVEWKFARSQLWISYFEDGGTLPPPFNMMPSVKLMRKLFGKDRPKRSGSFMAKSKQKSKSIHERVMKLLIRRFVTAEQRRRDDFTVTEDDIIEVRQDISSLRYELLDIFTNNNFDVPDIEKKSLGAAGKKGKILERRILKDFQIGFVEKLEIDLLSNVQEGQNIFTSLAQAMRQRKAGKSENDDKIGTVSSNPIGSTQSSMQRHSQRSLRRRMVEEANAGLDMTQQPIIAYNPQLGEVTRATRVAYVKFMKTKFAAEDGIEINKEKTAGEKTNETNSASTGGNLTAAFTKATLKKLEKNEENNKTDTTKIVDSKPQVPAANKKPADVTVKPAITKPDEKTKPPAVDKKDETNKKDTKPEATKTTEAKKSSTPPVPGKPAASKPQVDANKSDTKSDTKPISDASGTEKKSDDKNTDAKKTDEKKADDKKAEEKKPGDKKPEDKKPDDKKSEEKKTDDKKSEEKKTDDKGIDDKKPGNTKTDDDKKSDNKKTDENKPEDKKNAPPKPAIKVGQSSAAAGGDRGKSVVTGRMISGWL